MNTVLFVNTTIGFSETIFLVLVSSHVAAHSTIKVYTLQSEASYSYKFQLPQENHFSIDRPFLIHVITNTHNEARKSGL